MKTKFIALFALAVTSLIACSRTSSSSASSFEEDTFKTYINYTFDELEVGDLIDFQHDDYAFFEYYEGDGFKASSKDENGDVWISTASSTGWGLVYTYAYEGHIKVKLKDFAMSYRMRIPSYSAPLEGAMEGGSCLLWNQTYGRYDFAIRYGNSENGVDGNSMNLWSALDVNHGPYASTEINDTYGDRGSKVTSFSLSEDQIYQVTLCCKYEGEDEYGDEYMTLFAFIDDQLVIKQDHIPFWNGGFGFRGLASTMEYGDLFVTDFPELCPDGIDHYHDDEDAVYLRKTYTKLDTPSLNQEGSVISWNEIPGAGGYAIYFEEERIAYVKEPRFDYSSLYGIGTIKVQAEPNSFTKLMSDRAEIEISHPATKIIAPTLTLVDNVVSWNECLGASEYDIYLNGNKEATQKGTSYRIKATETGEYRVQVKAISKTNAYNSSALSDPVVYLIEGLATPEISYDKNTKTVSWGAIDNADGYEIYLNNQPPFVINDTSYRVDLNEFSLKIKAVDSTNVYRKSQFSNIVSSHELITLPTPVLRYQGNKTIVWNEITGSDGYDIYQNNAYLCHVEGNSYQYSQNGVYAVKAVGNYKTILNSSLSNAFTTLEDGIIAPLFYDETSLQEVGEIAKFGWNTYDTNGQYVIKEKQDGITWMGATDVSTFKETWFWARTNDNKFLNDWSFTTYVKKVNDKQDCVQLMFGTSADRGRYSCFFYFLDGGSMQIYHDGKTVANSYETEMGGTLALQNEVTLENFKESKITINHSKGSNKKARITVYVDDVLVIDKTDLTLAVGDFGLWLNEGVDCWFGNPIVTTINNAPDARYIRHDPITLNKVDISCQNNILTWSNQDYCFGYDVYVDGCKEETLPNNVTSYEMKQKGSYQIVAIGDNQTILNSEISNSFDYVL